MFKISILFLNIPLFLLGNITWSYLYPRYTQVIFKKGDTICSIPANHIKQGKITK